MRAGVFLAVGFFADDLAEVFLAGVFLAEVFLAAVFFVERDDRGPDFDVVFLDVFLGVFLAAGFFAALFLRDAAGLRVLLAARVEVFLADALRVDFLATVFLAAPVPDLFDEAPREPDLRAAVFFAGLMAAGR